MEEAQVGHPHVSVFVDVGGLASRGGFTTRAGDAVEERAEIGQVSIAVAQLKGVF